MTDITWVGEGNYKYISAHGYGVSWSLDPGEGDSPEDLRATAKLFNDVADWLELND